MRIGLDIDSTLADTMPIFCQLYNRDHDTNYTKEDVTRWDFWKDWGMKTWEGDVAPIFREAWENYDRLMPTETNLDVKINKLRQFGEIALVTSQQIPNIPYNYFWLKFLHIEYDHFWLSAKRVSKWELPVDYLVDDNPAYANDLMDKRLGRQVMFVYDQPWNTTVQEVEDAIIRVQSFDDVINYLQNIYKPREVSLV